MTTEITVKQKLSNEEARIFQAKATELKLRDPELSYKDIAGKLGLAPTQVRALVEKQISEMTDPEVLERLRVEMYNRCSMIIQYQWPAVEEGSSNAANTAMKAMDRISKMYGIDAPQKIDMNHHHNQHRSRQAVVDLMKKQRQLAEEAGLDMSTLESDDEEKSLIDLL
jgi:hypothetical protein